MEVLGGLVGGVLMLLFMAVMIVLYAMLLGVPGALLLRMACSLLGESNPTYRKAIVISGSAFVLQILLMMIVVMPGIESKFSLSPEFSVLIGALAGFAGAAKVYSKMLPLRYGRALVLAFTQMLVLFIGCYAVVGLAISLGYLDPLYANPVNW